MPANVKMIIEYFKSATPVYISPYAKEAMLRNEVDPLTISDVGWVSTPSTLGLRVSVADLGSTRYSESPEKIPASMRVRVLDTNSDSGISDVVLTGTLEMFNGLMVIGERENALPRNKPAALTLIERYRNLIDNPLESLYSLRFRTNDKTAVAKLVSAKKILELYEANGDMPQDALKGYVRVLMMSGSLNTPYGWVEQIKSDIGYYSSLVNGKYNPSMVKALTEDLAALTECILSGNFVKPERK